MTEQATKQPVLKKLTGIVVSDKMDKTVTVEIKRYIKDAKYGKYYKKSKRYQAHDAENQYAVGDKVEITSSRPLSRHKSFVVSKKLA